MFIKRKKRKTLLYLAITLPLVLLALACDHGTHLTTGDILRREQMEVMYEVIVRPVENGMVRAIPRRGVQGTRVILVVNPDPGFMLQPTEDGLAHDRAGSTIIDGLSGRPLPYSFSLNGNIAITPNFIPVTSLTSFTASVSRDITGGTIAVYRELLSSSSGYALRSPEGSRNQQLVLIVYPDPGYVLKSGTLKYLRLDDNTEYPIPEDTMRFVRPDSNVMIYCEFERLNSADQLVESGKQALLREDYDSAVVAFEAAYRADPANQEAIFYSSLASLANIYVSTEFQRLIQRIGFTSFPNRLNNLLGTGDSWSNIDEGEGKWGRIPSWLQNYYGGITLPRIGSTPGGYYAVQNQDALTMSNKMDGEASVATFYMYLFFYLMGSQIDNMDRLVDDILRYGFGREFEEALVRAATMQGTIVMDGNVATKLRIPVFGNRADKGKDWDTLGGYIADGERAGRAELDMIFSSVLLVKSALEYLASYNLEFDRYLFRLWGFAGNRKFIPSWFGLYNKLNDPYTDRKLGGSPTDQVDWDLSQILNEAVDFYLNALFDYYDDLADAYGRRPWNPGEIPDMLPLRNNLLKQRRHGADTIRQSRVTLARALAGFENARAYYFNPANDANLPAKIKMDLTDYQWAAGFLQQSRAAVDSGGNLYFPHLSLFPVDMAKPPDAGWNYTSGNARYGVNIGKLFTPGQFNLDKIIVSMPGGRYPRFYGWNDANVTGEGDEIRRLADIEGFAHIGIRLNMGTIKEVVVLGLHRDGQPEYQNIENAHTIFEGLLFSKIISFPGVPPSGPDPYRNGEMLYRLYHDLYAFNPVKPK